MHRILITSVGSNVGGNILLSLAHRRGEFYMIGTNTIGESAFVFMCDEAHRVPAVADAAAFRARIEALIAEARPDLVLAGRDEDVTVLAQIKQSGKFPEVEFLLPSLEAAKISNDKYASFLFAERHGLRFAPSAAGVDEALVLAREHGYPMIAKPRLNGHASRDVFIVRSEEELRAAAADGRFVMQAMIGEKQAPAHYDPISAFGVPLYYSFAVKDQVSCHGLVGRDGALLYQVASRNFYSFGRSQKYEPLDDPKILACARDYGAALAQLGYFGPLNMQGKIGDDGELYIYEINMRFTGATQGRAMLGWREVEFAVDYIFNGRTPKLEESPVGQRIAVREPFAYALETDAINAFDKSGVWRRP